MDTKHLSPTRRGPHRGLTLLETAITVALTAIVAAGAAPSLRELVDGRRLEATATQLATDIRYVRAEAIARQRPLRLSLHAGAASSCWILHTGSAAQCDCTEVGAAVCTGGASAIKTVLLPAAAGVAVAGNVGSIVFDPMHGTSTPTGTVRITLPGGRAIHHVVNVVGRVRSCSPAGAMPAYPAC